MHYPAHFPAGYLEQLDERLADLFTGQTDSQGSESRKITNAARQFEERLVVAKALELNQNRVNVDPIDTRLNEKTAKATAHGTNARKSSRSKTNLKKLASIPPLPPDRRGWVPQVVAARLLIENTGNSAKDSETAKRKVHALKKARSRGIRDKELTCGIDNSGLSWREDPADKKTVWYLQSTLDKKKQG